VTGNKVTGGEVAAAMTMPFKEVTHGKAAPAKVTSREDEAAPAKVHNT
jgi:hypothetical protein